MFDEAPIPERVKPLRSNAYVSCYRYLARERLLHSQPAIARMLAFKAFFDRNIKLMDALKQCGPIVIRSFLPTKFDDQLVQWRRAFREFQQKSRSQTQYQALSQHEVVV
jgi:hypothetical protein